MTVVATFVLDEDGIVTCQGCGQAVATGDGRLWPASLAPHLSCFELGNRGREAEGAPLLTESSQSGAAGSNPAGSATRPNDGDSLAAIEQVCQQIDDAAEIDIGAEVRESRVKLMRSWSGRLRRATVALAAAPPAEGWLIWSNEHGSWWAPNESGYVSSADLAGRYPFAQAADICLRAGVGKRGVPHETMVPAPPIDYRKATRDRSVGT